MPAYRNVTQSGRYGVNYGKTSSHFWRGEVQDHTGLWHKLDGIVAVDLDHAYTRFEKIAEDLLNDVDFAIYSTLEDENL